jgi:hypothetical protein
LKAVSKCAIYLSFLCNNLQFILSGGISPGSILLGNGDRLIRVTVKDDAVIVVVTAAAAFTTTSGVGPVVNHRRRTVLVIHHNPCGVH